MNKNKQTDLSKLNQADLAKHIQELQKVLEEKVAQENTPLRKMMTEIYGVQKEELRQIKNFSKKEFWFYIKPDNLTEAGAVMALLDHTEIQNRGNAMQNRSAKIQCNLALIGVQDIREQFQKSRKLYKERKKVQQLFDLLEGEQREEIKIVRVRCSQTALPSLAIGCVVYGNLGSEEEKGLILQAAKAFGTIEKMPIPFIPKQFQFINWQKTLQKKEIKQKEGKPDFPKDVQKPPKNKKNSAPKAKANPDPKGWKVKAGARPGASKSNDKDARKVEYRPRDPKKPNKKKLEEIRILKEKKKEKNRQRNLKRKQKKAEKKELQKKNSAAASGSSIIV